MALSSRHGLPMPPSWDPAVRLLDRSGRWADHGRAAPSGRRTRGSVHEAERAVAAKTRGSIMTARVAPFAERAPRPRPSEPTPPEKLGLAVTKRELRRASTRALGMLVATYLSAIGGFILLTLMGLPSDWASPVAVVMFLAIGPLQAAYTWLAMRRRFLPGVQALRWANGAANAIWIDLDGGAAPADVDEALTRLASRAGDDAVAMRAAWLASAERTAELRAVLDDWTPSAPDGVARRARMASILALLEGGGDDLGSAWEAASAIPEPRLRVENQARVLVEDARRRIEGGEDPFPRLVEAHDLLGPRAAEFDTDEDRRGIRRELLLVAAGGILPSIAFGLVGLAAWNGLLGW